MQDQWVDMPVDQEEVTLAMVLEQKGKAFSKVVFSGLQLINTIERQN